MNKNFLIGLGLGYLFTQRARRNSDLGGFVQTGQEGRFRKGAEEDKNINNLFADLEDASVSQKAEVEKKISKAIRDSASVKRIKEEYEYQCQACYAQLCGKSSPYAEAAHIRPLSSYTDPRDPKEPSQLNDQSNLLCLCPNCHKSFDEGSFYIEKDRGVWKIKNNTVDLCEWTEELVENGELAVKRNHVISNEYANYHREMVEAKGFRGIRNE